MTLALKASTMKQPLSLSLLQKNQKQYRNNKSRLAHRKRLRNLLLRKRSTLTNKNQRTIKIAMTKLPGLSPLVILKKEVVAAVVALSPLCQKRKRESTRKNRRGYWNYSHLRRSCSRSVSREKGSRLLSIRSQ